MRICGRPFEMPRFIPRTVRVSARSSQNKWDRCTDSRIWRFNAVELWFPSSTRTNGTGLPLPLQNSILRGMSKALENLQSRKIDHVAAQNPSEILCNALACQQRLNREPGLWVL